MHFTENFNQTKLSQHHHSHVISSQIISVSYVCQGVVVASKFDLLQLHSPLKLNVCLCPMFINCDPDVILASTQSIS